MKVIVTGAAGFIGSNIVKRLNELEIQNIIIVDRLDSQEKVKNLQQLKFYDFVDYDAADLFLRIDEAFPEEKDIVVVHQGACSDTMNADGQHVLKLNYESSKKWLWYCTTRNARMIYASSASVYGDGKKGFSIGNECPTNIYGMSKFLFDNFVNKQQNKTQIVGLRYFNVYGPGELHKGKMASCMLQFFEQSLIGKIKLFKNSDMIKRDFIHVDDVVSVVLFMIKNPSITGVFNCGTGVPRSFSEVANLVRGFVAAPGLERPPISTIPLIEEIDMPRELQGKYQNFTCADISSLRAVGYDEKFMSLETGVRKYLETFV